MYRLIWWWWVWSFGAYWDDEGWSAYLGPFELRLERDNFRLGTKTPPTSEKSLSKDRDDEGRPPFEFREEW